MAAKDLYEKDFYKILGLGKSASGDDDIVEVSFFFR